MKKIVNPLKLSLLALFAGTLASQAATSIWNGSVNANWNTANNWTPAAVPSAGYKLIFGTSAQTAPNNDITDGLFGGITFAPGGSAFILGGNSFTLDTALVVNSNTVLQTLGLPVVLTNTVTFETVSNLDTTVGDIEVVGAISGGTNAVLIKSGGGTLTLNSKSYGGGTIVNGGLLVVSNDNGGYTMSGGSLMLNFRTYYSGIGISLTADSAVGIDLLDNTEPRGIDCGSTIGTPGYKLTKIGQGILRMSGGINASSIDVAAGTLASLGGSAMPQTKWGTNLITVENGATLRADDGGICPNPIVLKGGDGTSAGSYTHEGVLVSGSRNNGGNPTNNIFNNTITLAADSTIGSYYGNMIISGNITGPGALTKIGTNPLILGGTNSYGGDTTIAEGTVQLASSTALPGGATNGNINLTTNRLDLSGFNASINGLNDDGSGAAMVDNSAATPSSLTFGGNNQSITLTGPVKNSGGGALSIIKNGAGPATLLGVNTYSGANIVSAGSLEINIPTGTTTGGLVSVADGAMLTLDFRLPASSLLAAGATLGTSGATTLNINLGNYGNPPKPVINATNGSGILSANGTITVNISGNGTVMSVGQFPLIKYTTRTGSGNFVVGALPASVVAQIVTNTVNKSIDLKVTSAPVTTWVGNVNNLWDVNATANWKTFGVAGKYVDGIAVLFDDSAVTNKIKLTTYLYPAAVTVNTTNNYSFGDVGALAGGDLTKSGSGTLTLLTPNSHNNTLIAGGTLLLADGPSGPGTLGTGTLDDEAILTINSSNVMTIANVISGAGSVIKQNTNLLILSAANSYSGGTTISQGVVRLDNSAGLGTPVTGLPLAMIASGAALNVNGQMTSVTNPVVISGPGVATNEGAIFNTAGQGCEVGCAKFGVRNLTLAGDAAIGNDGGSFSIGNNLGSPAGNYINGNGFSLTKIGNNTLILSSIAGSAPSQFVITAGGVLQTAANPIGGIIVISNNAWMDVFDNVNNGGFTLTNRLVVGAGGAQLRNTRGAYYGQAAKNTYTGSVTLNDNLTITNTSTYSGAPNNVLTLGTITFNGPITGPGGIIYNASANPMILNGANTYTGPTILNGGQVQLATVQQGGGVYTNNDGGILDVATQNGYSTVPMSALALGSINGATLNFTRLTVLTTNAPVTATNLVLTGINALNAPAFAYAAPGQHPLIKYGTLSGGGSLVLGGAVRGVPGYISNNIANRSFDLVVPGGAPVIWTGISSAVWDIATTLNWQTNGVATDYEQVDSVGDAVTFDDSSSVTNVSLPAPVSPAVMIVNNTSKNYTLTGTNIIGSTALLKEGTGTLLLTNGANTFIGGTTIVGGTVKLGSAGSLNTAGIVTVAGGGTLDLNGMNANGITVNISGGGVGGNGAIVNSGPGGNNVNPGTINLTGSATIGGANEWDLRNGARTLNTPTNAYTLTKVGAGSIKLANSATISPNLGDIYILGGMIGFESAVGFGDPNKTIFIGNGGTLGLWQSTVPLSKNLVCSNGAIISPYGGNAANYNIIAAPVTLVGGTVYLNGNYLNGMNFSNVISGAGGLNEQYNTSVTFYQPNTYTGDTYSGGGLTLKGNATISSTNIVNFNNGGTAILTVQDNAVVNGQQLQLYSGPATGCLIVKNNGTINSKTIQVGNVLADWSGRTDGMLTLQSGQTLRIDNGGRIKGNVVAAAGSTFSPGGGYNIQNTGIFTNALTLQAGSTTFMDVSLNGGVTNNDAVTVLGALTYGGALQINNLGTNKLTAGNVFKLFSGGSYSGSFSSISTNINGQFITWDTTQLAVSGTLSVVSATANNRTDITALLSGGTLQLSWPGDHLGWTLQTNSVGLAAPGSWYPYPGSASLTNVNLTIDPNHTNVFYRLSYP